MREHLHARKYKFLDFIMFALSINQIKGLQEIFLEIKFIVLMPL